jgi:hypothetical protein
MKSGHVLLPPLNLVLLSPRPVIVETVTRGGSALLALGKMDLSCHRTRRLHPSPQLCVFPPSKSDPRTMRTSKHSQMTRYIACRLSFLPMCSVTVSRPNFRPTRLMNFAGTDHDFFFVLLGREIMRTFPVFVIRVTRVSRSVLIELFLHLNPLASRV